jgi:tetratricopeptide (TPR) repeat protein
LAACPKPPGAGTSNVSSAAGDASVLVSKADALWDERVDEAKLEEALDAYEEALKLGGSERHVLTRLTRGWYFWGDAFSSDKDVQIERWSRALEYGNQCIALNSAIATARANGQKDKDTAALAKEEDVPCLYWTATALGKWGKAKGIANTMAQLPTVKAYIAKVEELDPSFYHYGPARYWGAFYAALPSFAGQDLARSATEFEKSVQGAPYYLPTRVLRAEYLAVATEDIKVFDQDLVHVLTADPGVEPRVRAENVKDQEKARALLARRAELFPKDVIAAAGPAPDPATLKPAMTAVPADAEPTVAVPADAEAGEDAGAKPAAAEPAPEGGADAGAKPAEEPAPGADAGAKPAAEASTGGADAGAKPAAPAEATPSGAKPAPN